MLGPSTVGQCLDLQIIYIWKSLNLSIISSVKTEQTPVWFSGPEMWSDICE
jgi:hypothetical protein